MDFTNPNINGDCALHYAVYRGSVDIIKLFEKNVNYNFIDKGNSNNIKFISYLLNLIILFY